MSAAKNGTIGRRPAATGSDALFAGGFLLACAAVFRFTAEDAFIVQRYATHLVEGRGLVYNIGERVSALTSPLHALLLSTLTLLSPWPMNLYKAIGAGVVLLALWYVGRQQFGSGHERRVFFSATLASPFVAMWSVGGLETPLLLACLTSVTVLALRALRERPSSAELLVFFAVAALAFLLRHDSVLWTGPLAAGVALKHPRGSAPGILLAALAVGSWGGFAWGYYGDVLPTSFYAKAIEGRPSVLGGAGYEASFIILCLLPVVLVRRPTPGGLPLAAWAAIAAFLAIAAAVGHVHMMFGYRFYVPVLPALVTCWMLASRPIIRIERWAFVLPLTANLVLFCIVHSYTVNPTIFHPALYEPHYGFLHRQANRGLAYEYTRLSASDYGSFIEALRRSGQALRRDAEARGILRSASLATIIAGATPNEVPEIYVYDHLVGARRNCPTLTRFETYRAADYIQFIVPRFGPEDEQLGALKETAVLVSDIRLRFDGRMERMVVYFNPAALHTPVPKRLHDPCPAGRL